MDYTPKGDGSISEWNEGNFKNLRLHEAQELINEGKIEPFSLSLNKTSWNFQIWRAGIDILFGEGKSKYSKEEIEEVEKIKSFLEVYLDLRHPFKRITEYFISSKKDKFIPIHENQKKIKELLEKYEEIVKRYNDTHGLSTRNKDEYDEGL